MHRPFMCEFLGTPEAGKTTVIQTLNSSLKDLGYSCIIQQESAEILPKEFKKGSVEAHFWMRLNTSKSILENMQNPYDIMLIDRGIIDTLFWDLLFYKDCHLSDEEYKVADAFFTNLRLKPDLVIWLTIPAEESIRRRGGEGRIVTRNFVENFNDSLSIFSNSIKQPLFKLDTLNKSPSEVHSDVLKRILKEYQKHL